MKIYLATDHAGFEIKEKIKVHLQQKGYEVTDYGAYKLDPNDDYPDFISQAAASVSSDPDQSRGIILGGSGQAEMMLANKYKNVRCGLFYCPAVAQTVADVTGRISSDPFEIIRLLREHNNSNMLSLSARFLKEEDAVFAIDLWLATKFPKEERHVRRLAKIAKIESEIK